MGKTTIYYYLTASGEVPVKKFIESLIESQQRKIARVLSHIEEHGIVTAIPHIKKVTGTSLWEIRSLGQDNIRIFYASVFENSVVLLHGFIKKSQKTPTKELKIALNRLKDWSSRFTP